MDLARCLLVIQFSIGYFLILHCAGQEVQRSSLSSEGEFNRHLNLQQRLRAIRERILAQRRASKTATENKPAQSAPEANKVLYTLDRNELNTIIKQSSTPNEFFQMLEKNKQIKQQQQQQVHRTRPGTLMTFEDFGIASVAGISPSGDVFAALQHWGEVKHSAVCRVPKPIVEDVRKYHPDAATSYIPHCIILHRCSTSSGCCGDPNEECVMRKSETIEKPFLVIKTVTHGVANVMSYPETLKFENHTECECRKKLIAVSAASVSETTCADTRCKRCPTPFSLRVTSDGTCLCDCFDKNYQCLALKRGLRVINQHEHRCIDDDVCHPPSCEAGVYNLIDHRCPRIP